MRTLGRQAFLENPTRNFSRILYQYTEDRKGFMVWKGMLEEGVA